MTTTMGSANNSVISGPPPEGVYLVQLKLLEEQTEPTQFSPNGQFKWVMAVKSVQVGGDEAEAYVGEEVWGYSNIMPQGYGTKSKTRQWWEAFAGRELEDGEEMTIDAILRKTALAYVAEYTKADGKTRSTKVDRLAKASGKAKVKQPEPDDEDF